MNYFTASEDKANRRNKIANDYGDANTSNKDDTEYTMMKILKFLLIYNPLSLCIWQLCYTGWQIQKFFLNGFATLLMVTILTVLIRNFGSELRSLFFTFSESSHRETASRSGLGEKDRGLHRPAHVPVGP